MKVILEDDVPNVGAAGSVAQVADGYARNFLIPRGLARPATPGGQREAAGIAERARRRAAREEAAARETAARIEAVTIEIPLKTGEEDRVFGAATTADIAEALARQGVEIDRHRIVLEAPIKTLGDHRVPVRLARGVSATLKVRTVKSPSGA